MDLDISPWLVLKSVNGVGNILTKRLIEKFSNPEKIFSASIKELCSIDGMTQKKAQSIKQAKETNFIKDEIKSILKENIKFIHFNHEDYPVLLKNIIDPPPFLYLMGNHPSDIVCIAIVGSRKASNEGRAKASKLARIISKSGVRVISGMALGIDGASHSSALNFSGGTTAVLGSGLLNIYPREHRTLFNKIIEKNGGIFSEFFLNQPPDTHNFPKRNRIVSGISIGVVVVEAGEKSGAIITAKTGAEQGKEIFVVNLEQTKSPGTDLLNELGAKKINSVIEIFEEFPWLQIESLRIDNKKKSLDFNEETVIKALKQSEIPLNIDEICRNCNLKYSNQIGSVLLNLELEGIIKQLPGKFYYLTED
ncbi:MAG: DNA-processing protein DprA [Desulforegulaceae bacterium]|nr:DNA-processing protein DprA [Desulforegulaceae bacterium]